MDASYSGSMRLRTLVPNVNKGSISSLIEVTHMEKRSSKILITERKIKYRAVALRAMTPSTFLMSFSQANVYLHRLN